MSQKTSELLEVAGASGAQRVCIRPSPHLKGSQLPARNGTHLRAPESEAWMLSSCGSPCDRSVELQPLGRLQRGMLPRFRQCQMRGQAGARLRARHQRVARADRDKGSARLPELSVSVFCGAWHFRPMARGQLCRARGMCGCEGHCKHCRDDVRQCGASQLCEGHLPKVPVSL